MLAYGDVYGIHGLCFVPQRASRLEIKVTILLTAYSSSDEFICLYHFKTERKKKISSLFKRFQWKHISV